MRICPELRTWKKRHVKTDSTTMNRCVSEVAAEVGTTQVTQTQWQIVKLSSRQGLI
jgi:hypothetical protein